MSMPPNNGGYPQDPYGQGGQHNPNQGGYPQEQGGYGQPSSETYYHQDQGSYGQQPNYSQPQTGRYDAQTGSYIPGDPNAGYADPYQQHDPYQQQYQVYSQGHTQAMPAQSWQGQQPYGAPGGPGWGGQPPKSNKLPWIIAGALVVIGAVVAVILLTGGKDDNKASGSGGGSSQSQSQQSSDNPTTTGKNGSSGKSGNGGAGSGLPSSLPVPKSVKIDPSATVCSGNSCFGAFDSSDPEQAYNDWLTALEDAGYQITSNDLTGSGSSTMWSIEASGPMDVYVAWMGGGVLATS